MQQPAILARGPWSPERVHARWKEEQYEPPAQLTQAADDAIAALRDRGSPSHDGLSARLVDHEERDGELLMELQPMRWALRLVEGGAGGAVDIGESPAHTLTRELREEWSVEPEELTVEALVRLPHQLVMVVGLAWLPDGAEISMDPEHDAHAWWPADVAAWPDEADEPLRRMATLLAASA